MLQDVDNIGGLRALGLLGLKVLTNIPDGAYTSCVSNPLSLLILLLISLLAMLALLALLHLLLRLLWG
jgi:hypothetical protein